jgi:NAD(P)-dependent dehydrogenase (short-subunit alcohol dehydrogenase family)
VSAPFSLDGKVALVTGGSGRLGGAAARALAAAGARVVVAGRSIERLTAVVDELGRDRSAALQVDLADEGSITKLFDEVERQEGRLAILVNNAGIASEAPLDSLTAEQMHDVFAVNVVAATLCAQRAAPLMSASGGGKIVNVGSIYGTVAPNPNLYEGSESMVRASPPYVASKGALVSLTRDLAVRLAPSNIQVNMVSPGGIEADQPAEFKRRYAVRTPGGRMGTPADVAGAVVFLASPASDYVTGQNLHVDGGFTAW